MSRRLVSAVAVSVLLSLTLVVGCSSSDSSDAKDADAKTTTSEAGSGKTTTTKAGDEPTETTEADGGTETTAGGGGGIELKGDFCEKARQLEGASDQIFGETSTDTSPEGLLAGLKQTFRSLDDVYGQLNDDPPAEIADEIALLADFASSNYDKVKDAASYEEAAKVAQSAFGEDSQTSEFQAASDKIGAYVEKECGIEQG